MGLNLKDPETVALVTEVATRLGLSKTGAVRELARQRLAELDARSDAAAEQRASENLRWLEEQVWPTLAGVRIDDREIEELAGYDEMTGR